jgi:5-methylthioadenosine/S-adenosylhomocysteine deaminase
MPPMSSFSTWSTLINYVPLQAPLLQLVFAENGAAVDSVMIGGRMVLEHGRLLTIDESKLKHDT